MSLIQKNYDMEYLMIHREGVVHLDFFHSFESPQALAYCRFSKYDQVEFTEDESLEIELVTNYFIQQILSRSTKAESLPK